MIEPQILVAQGRHNESDFSLERLKASGVWKHQRIVVIIPAGASIPTKVAISHWNLYFPPNNGVMRIAAIGMEVGEAYSQTIKWILEHPELKNWEYILTIEHDNIPPPDGVMMLVESMEAHPEYDVIGGLYWTKGEGGVPQIWGDPKDPLLNFRPQVPLPDTIQECCGTGMGFNLWRIRSFREKKVPEPLFKTSAGTSQDLYFWAEGRKYGWRCAIDTRVKVGHYEVERDLVW